MELYIIVKQLFYIGNGEHHQIADDNPIVKVYKSVNEAEKFCDRMVKIWLKSHPSWKLKMCKPNSELVSKYGLFNGEVCELAYSIVKEYAL